MTALRAVSTVSTRKRAQPAAKLRDQVKSSWLGYDHAGSNRNTLGKSYELRGNGADGSHWRDKPPMLGHASARRLGFHAGAWTRYMPDGRFYADFCGRFPALDRRPCRHMVGRGRQGPKQLRKC